MSDQNNYFPQQPQYFDPQEKTQYGQPQYVPGPAPVYDAPESSAEPEVILQEIGFADYGFGEGDSISSGHDFGNFMDDDNHLDPMVDEFDAFNSQTPNFDIAAVEAASKAASDDEKAMFTSTTPNLDLADVEAASNTTLDSDRDIFSNSFAVGAIEQTVSETPSFDAATAIYNKPVEPAVPVEPTPAPIVEPEAPAEPEAPTSAFLASMQSMFASMNGTPAPAIEVESTPIEEPVPVAEPMVEPAPAPIVEPAPAQIVELETAPVESEEKIEIVVTSGNDSEEKGPEYWENINKMLEGFETKPAEPKTSEPSYEAPYTAPVMPAAPSFDAVPAEVEDVLEEEEKEAKKGFPFSESAQEETSENIASQTPVAPTNNFAAPVAPVAPAAPITPVAPVVPVAPSEPEPIALEIVEDSSHEEVSKEDFSIKIEESEMFALDDEQDDIVDKRAAKKAERAERDAKRAEKASALEAEKAAKKLAKEEAKLKKKADKEEAKLKKKANKEVAIEEKEDALKPLLEPQEEKKSSKGFKNKVLPNRDDSTTELIRKIVALVSATVLLVCAIYFLISFIGSKSNEKDSSKLSGIMTSSETNSSDWKDIYTRYPNIVFPSGMQTKFADIYAMNTDLVGWIRIPGLGIDYPVVQTTDDSYYLKHDFNKDSSVYGTIFLSSKNGYKNGLDLNTVIYGHSMRRDKQMFSRLHDYKESSAFVENPIIEFNTLYNDYKFKVYCVFITNGSTAQDNGFLLDYTFSSLSSSESFAGFVAEINQRKLYNTGVDILPTDKIVTLSTCSYEFDNARLVIIGRMLRKGESEEVDTSKVETSSNPRYPQAWYDANKKTNPYASYSHWVAS